VEVRVGFSRRISGFPVSGLMMEICLVLAPDVNLFLDSSKQVFPSSC